MRRALATPVYVFCVLIGVAQLLPVLSAQEVTPRFLTSDSTVSDYWPSFSPDGATLVFSRRVTGTSLWELFVVPVAGGVAHRLADTVWSLSATRSNWSARSNLIAFTGTAAGQDGAWLVSPSGADPRPFASPGLSDRVFYPSWYPDGEHVAVLDAGEAVVKRIDRHRSMAVTVTNHAQVLTGMPSVSPDGKWIAFAGQRNAGQPYDQTKNTIWLVDDAGTAKTVESVPLQGRTPSWSPDGHWLAFESNRGSPSPDLYAVFVFKRDGTGLRRLTVFDFNAQHPVWSPDGKRLAIAARQVKGRAVNSIAIIEFEPR